MNEIKIIFFDIDGTLIDMNQKCISEKTREALLRLKERNILLCLATGRSPLGLPHFDGLEFDAFVTFNGSYCFHKQQTFFSDPIPSEDVKKVIQNAAAINRPVAVATRERLIANGADDDLIEYHSFADLKVNVADDFDDVVDHEAIYQVLAGCRKEDHSKLMKNVRHAKITAWWDRAVDIIPATSGKGIGINRILSCYHLNPSDALAFGDGNNDIEMLQAVGLGVAMGNASDRLKAAADDLCGSAADDGIYHYCIAHKLI